MDGWMDGWIDRWVGGWTDGWIHFPRHRIYSDVLSNTGVI